MSKQIVVDTNVLVSFLTDRDPVQQEQAAALFRGAAAGSHVLILHQIALSEMVYVLLNLYGVSPVEGARILADLLATPGIQPVHELSWPLFLGLWPETISSFSDAAIAAVAKQGIYDEVATFDRPLARRLKRQGLRTCWYMASGSRTKGGHETRSGASGALRKRSAAAAGEARSTTAVTP